MGTVAAAITAAKPDRGATYLKPKTWVWGSTAVKVALIVTLAIGLASMYSNGGVGSILAALVAGLTIWLAVGSVTMMWRAMRRGSALTGTPRIPGWQWDRERFIIAGVFALLAACPVLVRYPTDSAGPPQQGDIFQLTAESGLNATAAFLIFLCLFTAVALFGIPADTGSNMPVVRVMRDNLLFSVVSGFLWGLVVLALFVGTTFFSYGADHAETFSGLLDTLDQHQQPQSNLVLLAALPPTLAALAGIGFSTTFSYGATCVLSVLLLQRPPRLLHFLDATCYRGLMRRGGAIFSFRHIAVQQQLSRREIRASG